MIEVSLGGNMWTEPVSALPHGTPADADGTLDSDWVLPEDEPTEPAPAWQALARCAACPVLVLGAAVGSSAAWGSFERAVGARGWEVAGLPVALAVAGAAAVASGVGRARGRPFAAVLAGIAAGAVPWLVDVPWGPQTPASLLLLPVVAFTAGIASARAAD